ncbi:hypothetical protein [Micromonospora gifhornensis]|nr:hypothetical protein [Micromonospora gifhornensis]
MSAIRRYGIAVSAMTAIVLGVAHPAPAVDAGVSSAEDVVTRVFNASDPEAFYRGLSPTERAAFDHVMIPVTSTLSVEIEPADAVARNAAANGQSADEVFDALATGCWYGRTRDGAQAAAGNTLYTFWTNIYWCASGSTVTSVRIHEADGETKTIGWRYDGVKSSGAQVISNQGRGWAKHRFILGVGGWDVSHPEHCLRAKGTASGTASGDRVCSVL